MKRILILLLSVIAFSCTLKAQTNAIILKNEFRVKGKEGFREAWKAIKQGDELFAMGKGAYYLAKENYKLAYEYNDMNPELNYKLGVSLLMSDEKQKARDFLEMAYESKSAVTPDIQLMLGRSYHINNDFDKALEYYNSFKNNLSQRKLKKIGTEIDLLIAQCNTGKELINNPVRAVIEDMGSNINSEYDEYTPLVSANDSIFFFTSRRDHSKGSKIHELDYKYYESVYYSVKSGDSWGPAIPFSSKTKIKENTAASGIANNGRTIYIYKGIEGGGDIYVSNYKKNKWSKPKSVGGHINSSSKEGSIAISSDGSTMYFTSNRKKGTGGFDIYISRLKKKDKWGKPENAGIVNTPFDEMSVAIHPNGKILYFSSKGHNSMGGYDIFKCDIDGSGNLSNVENIGYPVNTAGDDMFYTPSYSGKIAYISSIRENTMGARDIYRVNMLGPEKQLIPAYDEITLTPPDKNIFFDETAPVDFESVTEYTLSGIVTDVESNTGLFASVQLIKEATKKSVNKVNTSDFGSYTISVNEPVKYIIKVLSGGYMPYSDEIDFSFSNKIERNVALEKIKVGKKMVLKNIYFDSGTSRLRKESTEELENVYAFLEGNPTTVIEIAGYTDNIGSIEYNERLSKSRAKACVDYLVNKGIDKSRLKYAGYGFLNPYSDNHTAKGRSMNRRVEFKILEQ